MLVILDSSILMLPLEKQFNITAEFKRILSISYNLVVPKIVIKELKELYKNALPAAKRKSKLALELANNFSVLASLQEGKADDEIFRLAKEHKAIVATNDTNLRKRLLKEGIPVISLHGKNKLKLFGIDI